MNKNSITLYVNGAEYVFSIGTCRDQVPPSETLSQTLRNRLDLTGVKEACNHGACGCCTVIMNGDAVTSCMLFTIECDGNHITTIEGLQDIATGALDPLQQAFIDHNAFQCGFCTPGIILTAKALLEKKARPTEEEIAESLSGNFCRCISQYHVIEAIADVVKNGGRRNHESE